MYHALECVFILLTAVLTSRQSTNHWISAGGFDAGARHWRSILVPTFSMRPLCPVINGGSLGMSKRHKKKKAKLLCSVMTVFQFWSPLVPPSVGPTRRQLTTAKKNIIGVFWDFHFLWTMHIWHLTFQVNVKKRVLRWRDEALALQKRASRHRMFHVSLVSFTIETDKTQQTKARRTSFLQLQQPCPADQVLL